MSYYESHDFTSPEPIYATVKEELKSYFDTGAVDDLMFPTYLNKCMTRLGKSSEPLVPTILEIEDYQARLPDNFVSVREAWFCTETTIPVQKPGLFYSQAASSITIQVAPVVSSGVPCTSGCASGCPDCMPEIAMAVYKTTSEAPVVYARKFMLRPGNISTRGLCGHGYKQDWERYGASRTSSFTPGSSTYDSFDVRGNMFTTNFRFGTVYLVYYSSDYDGQGNQLIPNNYRVKEYVEAFLKYKVFETLVNQTNDETFNQLMTKMNYYKQLSDEAYIMAGIEMKKPSAWQSQRRVRKSYNRHRKYDL